jgi:hypothetical protein
MAKRNLSVARPGERTSPQGKPVSNKILLAIPDGEYKSIRPDLEFLALPHHKNLYEPNRKFEFVYFPNRGLISLVVVMSDGRTVEVAVLGNEGCSGVPSIFGLARSPVRGVAQIAGDGFKINASTFQQTLRSTPVLRPLLGRYSIVLGMQISQTAACNRLPDVGCRLARWLLMAQDRVDVGYVAITLDFLATMLRIYRSSVSLAPANLQRKQIIDYTQGAVRILNRKNLEGPACGCYQAIQQFNGEIGLK